MKYLMVILTLLFMTACGTVRYGNGQFEDVNKVNLKDDNFSETHMMDFAQATVNQLLNDCQAINKDPNSPPPYMTIGQVRTENLDQQINIKMLTDRVKVELLRSGKVRFVATQSRQALEDEYSYSESGAVSGTHKKVRGKQIAPDYILVGEMAGNTQNGGKVETKYYQFTATLVDVETSAEVCSVMRDSRTVYKKGRY